MLSTLGEPAAEVPSKGLAPAAGHVVIGSDETELAQRSGRVDSAHLRGVSGRPAPDGLSRRERDVT